MASGYISHDVLHCSLRWTIASPSLPWPLCYDIVNEPVHVVEGGPRKQLWILACSPGRGDRSIRSLPNDMRFIAPLSPEQACRDSLSAF